MTVQKDQKKKMGLGNGYSLVGDFMLEPENREALQKVILLRVIISNAQGENRNYLLGYIFFSITNEVTVNLECKHELYALVWKSIKAVDLLIKTLLESAVKEEFKVFNLKEAARQIIVKIIKRDMEECLDKLDVSKIGPQKARALGALLDVDPNKVNARLKLVAKCH